MIIKRIVTIINLLVLAGLLFLGWEIVETKKKLEEVARKYDAVERRAEKVEGAIQTLEKELWDTQP